MAASVHSIVCPVDFSKGSEHALDRAAELARAFSAELELLHVYQLPVLALPDAPITATPTWVADFTNQAQQRLNEYRSRLEAHGLRVTTKLLEGNPASAIAEHVSAKPDSMLVLGTHGRTGFRRMILGSVAERVVRTSSVPVMTIPLHE